MTKEIQFRRGSTADHVSGVGFTGAVAEVTVDTTNNTLRVHDGSTKGGHELVGVSVTQTVTNKTIQAVNLNVSGITTAGITTVTSLNATELNVSGVSTFTQAATFNGLATFKNNIIAEQNLEVYGNITVGGTTVTLNTTQLQIADSDIVLGIGTTFSSTDSTANHGGIAVASTEGTPLVDLNIVPAETNPSTFKKIMWFKSGTATGLNTDAWLFNYGVGIGSTQIPNGVRFASGTIQFTQDDISVVKNINASGVITATNGPIIVGSSSSTGTVSQPLQVTGGAYISGSVGIGTTNPSTTLDVAGEILVRRTNSTQEGGQITFTRAIDDAQAYSIDVYNDVGLDPKLRFIDNVAGAERFSLDKNGNILVATGSSTGTVSQPLQVNGSAYVSGRIGIGSTNPQALLEIAPGTTSVPPLELNHGPVLTTPSNGAIEYDGTLFYATGVSTAGRGAIPTERYYRLDHNKAAFGPAIGDFFPQQTSITLTPGGVYEVEFNIYYTKTTAGIVTYTLTNSTSVTNMVASYTQSAIAGIAANASPTFAAVTAQIAAAVALPITGTLATGANHNAVIKVILENGSSTNLRLRVTSSAGTITPLRGSWWKAKQLVGVSSVGTLTA